MSDQDRRLAKTFFFWVLQGLRRQYTRIEPVFVAHTVDAWEFSESELFQVRGTGGTVASTAFDKISEIIDQRFNPAKYNIYIFYASDGENFSHDREAAMNGLMRLSRITNFMGYVETAGGSNITQLRTETASLFRSLSVSGAAVGAYVLGEEHDVWDAIRGFFKQQATPSE
jgi:hypothetical protein